VLTSFVGRKREIAEVRRLLASARLVTLTGAAGCGKTRLAVRIAGEENRRYADGIHWVELARLVDPVLVPQAVAKATRVAAQPGQPIEEALLAALQNKHLLLVLDDCEHLLSACTQLAEALLTTTAVSILATSRELLGVTGEMRYPVSPLSLPSLTTPPATLGQFDAIRLFVERARAILPDFGLTPDNATVIAGICRQLDGIPLAIELASARLNILTVEQIAARLEDRFALLSASHLTRSHHRTLRAAIDWSYDSLTLPEQVLLRRLSVFTGGCTVATAEVVCTGDAIEPEQMLPMLALLVNKSLVVSQTLQRGDARYALLETMRQYAQEKLIASAQWSAMRDRHLECFVRLAEDTAPKLSGPSQPLWLDTLEGEYDNLRAALSWSLQSNRIEAGLRIAVAIYQFWTIRDYVAEGFGWIKRLLAAADESVSAVVRANALAYAAFLAGFRGNSPAQIAYGRYAAALAEAAGDAGKPALAWALVGQAYGARAAGDFESEFALYERAIPLVRESGDRYQLSLYLSAASFPAMALGRFDAARTMLEESLALLRAVGNPYRIAMALNFLGDLARCEQNFVKAQKAYQESISLLRELGATRDLASALHNLGHTCLHLGETKRAYTLFAESLAAHQEQQNTPGVAECLIGFAALSVVCGLPAAGARLLGAAVAIGGQRIASAWAATRIEYEYYLTLIRAGLTETQFHAEQAAGAGLSLEHAVVYAHSLPLQSSAPTATGRKPDDLTLREREVADLIARGKSNGEIAAELVVSKRTVEKHIANILSKLGFVNRAQIVRWAIEAGLTRSVP
jgi:non-specific serine/threonine protein kinase